MIPALALIVGVYVILRALEVMTRPSPHPALYAWSILTALVSIGGLMYILLVADDLASMLSGLTP